MEILKYEKVEADFEPWSESYLLVAKLLIDFIRTEKLDAIHFGSTSAMVGGKGIIDLSILYKPGNLNLAVNHLKSLGFQNQVSSKPFPPERPGKDGAIVYKDKRYFVHVHAIEDGSEEHAKQIKYKEYLLSNPSARNEYEQSKLKILREGITDQEAYGELKSPFVKSVLGQIQKTRL